MLTLPCEKPRGNPDDWFADPRAGASTEEGITLRKAKQTCFNECPVRMACLQIGWQSRDTLDYGVYGGYDAVQRKAMLAEMTRRGITP